MYFIDCIIQGITETMPISSSAHLQLASMFFNNSTNNITKDSTNIHIPLHLASAFGTIFFFFPSFIALLTGFFSGVLHFIKEKFISCKKEKLNIFFYPALACLLAVLIPVIAGIFIKDYHIHSAYIIGITSIISGILLFCAEYKNQHTNKKMLKIENLTFKHGAIIGLYQIMAFAPGFSRLGACITAMRFLGFSVKDSWIISALIGAPLSIGAALFTFIKTSNVQFLSDFTIMHFAFTVILTIATYYISVKIPIKAFSLYKIIFGVFLIFIQ